MITANDQMVTIEREPGREPLPRLELLCGCAGVLGWTLLGQCRGRCRNRCHLSVAPAGRGLPRANCASRGPSRRARPCGPPAWFLHSGAGTGSLRFLRSNSGPIRIAAAPCRARFIWKEIVNRYRPLRPGKASEWCGNSGRPENSPSCDAQNAPSGLKLGKDLLHYLCYVTTTIPRSRRRGASPAPWGSGGLRRPMGIKEPP